MSGSISSDAFFRIPEGTWEHVLPHVHQTLSLLQEEIESVLATTHTNFTPSPATLALHLGTAARDLWDALAPEERDLREIITTLRTALAASLDLCPESQRERMPVSELLQRFRQEIESFEHDLRELQQPPLDFPRDI